MTEQEKQEFWKNQKLFTMSDVIKMPNAILLKKEAMQRIADEYNLTLIAGKIYTLREAREIILNEETKRRTKPLEDSATVEVQEELSAAASRIISYFRIVPESKKKDILFIAKELNRQFSRMKPSEVIEGINAAKAQGLIEDADVVIKEYNHQLGLKSTEVEAIPVSEEPSFSEDASRIASYFKIVPESKKKDTLFIAKELNNHFFRTKPSEIIAGIKAAEKQGLIDNADEIIKEYQNQLGLSAISINIEKMSMAIQDQDELVNKLSGFIFNNYKHGYAYGQLNFVLQKSSLSDEVKEKITNRFYELLMPEIEERYKNTKLRGSLLAKDILAHYENFDMNRIFAILDVTTQNLGLELVRYEAYRMDDEPFIKDILIEGNKKRKQATEIAEEIRGMGSEYPIQFIIKTIRDLQKMKLILPYDEIINALKNPQKEEKKEEESTELSVVTGDLQPVVLDRFELSTEGEFIETDIQPIEEDTSSLAETKPISIGKKHKILKREKAVSAADKKAVIAGLIVAAGAISTAVLSSVFGVSPIEAAKNTAASIASFVAGNAFLSQIIPKTVSLVQNLSVFGLATAGTVAWLRRRKAKQKEQRKQEILEVLEEVRRESEEAEKGGRTR